MKALIRKHLENILAVEARIKAEKLQGWDALVLNRQLGAEFSALGGRRAVVDFLANELGLKAVHDWTESKLVGENGMELVNFFETHFGFNFKPSHNCDESNDTFEKVSKYLTL